MSLLAENFLKSRSRKIFRCHMKIFKVFTVNASTNIALRSRKKITIIRNVDQRIFNNLESKNKSIMHTTVSLSTNSGFFCLYSSLESFKSSTRIMHSKKWDLNDTMAHHGGFLSIYTLSRDRRNFLAHNT